MSRRNRKARAEKSSADLGTSERADREGGIVVGARVISEGGVVLHQGARAANATIVEQMLREKFLLGTQGGKGEREAIASARFAAAERLQRMFHDAGLHELKAVNLNQQGHGGGEEISERADAARRRFNSVTRSLGQWMQCLTDIVLHNKAPASMVDVRNVCNALDRLCVEFGL